MTNIISTPQGFLVPSRDNPNLLYGEASFIHHQGQRLFSMTLDGKIVPPNSGVKVTSVYLHEYSMFLQDYWWYLIQGRIIISRKQTSAFFLPKQIFAEISPEEFSVNGKFTIPSNSDVPSALFKFKDNKIVPLSETGGLVVFKEFRYQGNIKRGHSYNIEGKVIIPYGHKAGICVIKQIKEL